MSNLTVPLTWKQITKFAVVGIFIVFGFLLAIVGIFLYDALRPANIALTIAPLCVLPYVPAISIYVGFFMSKLAKGKGKNSWVWGIIGFIMTIVFTIGFPLIVILSLFSSGTNSVFSHTSPVLFSFLAPFLSAPITALLISIRRKSSQSS